MRTLVGAVLIVAGLLACGLGILIWASISRSDTATGVLVLYGLTFAVPGAAALAAGAWLLRRGPPRG
jgi:xanthine/uracil permease